MLELHSFGYWLRLKRKALDLTREALADRVGCSVSTIRKLEEEERHPSTQIAELLAEIFKIPTTERTAFFRFARGDWRSAPRLGDEEAPWRVSTPALPQQPRSNLPATFTSLIGRDKDIAAVQNYLNNPDIRLVTLIGAPGIGKTRLSIASANKTLTEFSDGVFFVALAPLDQPSLISSAILQALGYLEKNNLSPEERLIEGIANKRLLLVLDNSEHLIEDVAWLTSSLLSACSRLKILITSREALRISGEWLYSVPALDMPKEYSIVDVKTISEFPAVVLFAERARAARSDFVLNAENIRDVASICSQLDGMPLAIELIAARVKTLSIEQIAARFDDRFALLNSGSRIAPSRHHTLRAAIDWSFDLLSRPEQAMLSRVTVLTGGFSLPLVEAVCSGNGIETSQILDLLFSLVNKSLLQADNFQRVETRYFLLETIQQYAREKLLASGESASTHERLLQYMLQWTEESAPRLKERYQQQWLDQVEMEYGNIRMALAWSLTREQFDAGLRIANAITEFWQKRGYAQEGLEWFEQLLEKAEGNTSQSLLVIAFSNAAYLAMLLGNTQATVVYGHRAGEIVKTAGKEAGASLGLALVGFANSLRAAGDFQTAFDVGEQALQLLREQKDSYTLGRVYIMQAGTAMALGQYDTVHGLLGEGLEMAREAGDPYRIALILNFRGDLERCERDYPGAKTNYENSIALFRQLNASRDLASALHNLGHTYLHLGDFERAYALFTESITIQQEQQNISGMAECLIGFAAIAVLKSMPAACARLLSAAIGLGGQRPANVWTATREEYEAALERTRSQLSETEFQAEQAVGHAFTIEQAVQYAFQLPLKKAQALQAISDALTAREHEIMILMAQGKSNGEIAEELVVSKRTVEKHIANILSKLRLSSRAQVVRWVFESKQGKQSE